MNEIKVYLAHYNNIDLMDTQVQLIRKFFKYNVDTSCLKLCGFVDSPNPSMKETMKKEWERLGVEPIDLPPNRHHYLPISYGLAFQHIYNNYIKKDNYISIFMENDMMPISPIDIEKYVEGYMMCAQIRFDGRILPKDRMIMHWLGLQMFNHKEMKDKDLYSGYWGDVKAVSGNTYSIDCGGSSYYWLMHNENYKRCKHIETIGSSSDYDPYKSPQCQNHSITTDVENLPELLRDGYIPDFICSNYDNKFIHLMEMKLDREIARKKLEWFKKHFSKLMES